MRPEKRKRTSTLRRPGGFAGSRELKSPRPDRFTGRCDVLTPFELLPHLMDFFGGADGERKRESERAPDEAGPGNEITLKMLLVRFRPRAYRHGPFFAN